MSITSTYFSPISRIAPPPAAKENKALQRQGGLKGLTNGTKSEEKFSQFVQNLGDAIAKNAPPNASVREKKAFVERLGRPVLDAWENLIKTDPGSDLTGFLEYNPADNRAAFFILHPDFPLISDPSVAPPDIRLNAILRSTAPELDLDLSQNPFPLLKEEPLNGNPESILTIVQTLKDAKAWSDRLTEALRPKPKKAVSPPSGRPPGGWFS